MYFTCTPEKSMRAGWVEARNLGWTCNIAEQITSIQLNSINVIIVLEDLKKTIPCKLAFFNSEVQLRSSKSLADPKVTRMFRRILSSFRNRIGHSRAVRNRPPFSSLKQSLETLLDDCETTRAQRVVHQIKSARTPGDLWDLRCEIHQCISHVHSQTEASRRINSLVTVFTGWIPPNKLTEI